MSQNGRQLPLATTERRPKLYSLAMPLISPQLKAILVCPLCHGELEEDEAHSLLRCQNDGREYPVTDGIPIMMVPDETAAETPVDAPDAA